MPSKYGNWHTIYMRFNRWSKNGTIKRILQELQSINIIDNRTDLLCIDSTFIKVHPDAAGALKKNGKQSIGCSKGGLTTKIHLCSSSDKFALVFLLSAGNKIDAPEGRKLIQIISTKSQHYLLADRAYEDNMTRKLSEKQGFIFVVPPKKNRKNPWKYNEEKYKRRNEIERYFRKLDVNFISVIMLVMIFDALLM